MKSTRPMLTMIAALFVLSAQAQAQSVFYGGGTGIGSNGGAPGVGTPGVGTPGVGPTLPVPLTNNDPLDGVKGTVGIVCVNNSGEKISWYPAAANSSLIAQKLRRCFEEVAMNWQGASGSHGLPDSSVANVPSPTEAYNGFVGIMQELELFAP